MSADLVDPASGSPLRGTRPRSHQTIEAKAHCQNDPATPELRLQRRTNQFSTSRSRTSPVISTLWINGRTAVAPELNRRRAVFVLGKIDEILSWEKTKEQEKDVRFVELGEYLCEVRSMPREEFKQEVERHLTGQETEPHEILYFKVYKSQLPVIEEALETAGLMLGSNKSRGYCLEMICADFLAGANLGETQQ